MGAAALAELAGGLYGETDPFAPPAAEPPLTIAPMEDGDWELVLALPLAEKEAVDLARKGDELIVTAGSYRRRTVTVGAPRDGRLRVRFEAGPGGRDD